MKKFHSAILTYFFMKNQSLANCITNYGLFYVYFVYIINEETNLMQHYVISLMSLMIILFARKFYQSKLNLRCEH